MVAQAAAPTWLRMAKDRNQPLQSITWDAGASGVIRRNLRNTGYLDRLHLIMTSNGTYATAGPSSADVFGQRCGPISRITLEANGTVPLFDCEGVMIPFISALDKQYHYQSDLSLNPDPGSFTAAPGTAAFANLWVYDLPIGLMLANKPTPYGLIQTALNAAEFTLAVRFTDVNVATTTAPGTGVYRGNEANLTGETGTLFINQKYYDPIPYPEAQPYGGFVHQWRTFRQSVTADGDVEIELPPQNYYLRVIIALLTGATAGALAFDAATPTRYRLAYGSNVTPYDFTYNQIRAMMSALYGGGATFPAGVVVFDWLEQTHTERDILNANAVTELRIIVTTAIGGGSYAGGAYFLVAVEQLIPVTVPGAGAAGVQGGY